MRHRSPALRAYHYRKFRCRSSCLHRSGDRSKLSCRAGVVLKLVSSQEAAEEPMVNRTIFVALLVVLSIAFLMPCVAQQSQPEKEILDLEVKMNAAYAANDLPTYFAYYADDFTQWLPEGRTDLPQYKKEWTEFIHSGGKIESDQISDMHVQVNPAGDT